MKSGFAVNIMQIQTEDILILLRYNIKINTDQELLERTQLNFYTLPPNPIKLKLSTGKPGFNSCRIVQMERKTKSGRDVHWFLYF